MIPCIIPARKGSKSIANKNIREVAGKPLLQWAIEAAKGAKHVDRVYVSTDSEFYGKLASQYGAIGMARPAHLAEDVPTEDVIIDALAQIRAHVPLENSDPVVTIQCTTPFVTSEDIDKAIEHYQTGFFNSVIAVTRARESPDWMFLIDGQNLRPFANKYHMPLSGEWGVRQTFDAIYRPNGAIYVTRISSVEVDHKIFAEPIGYYFMPTERSWDIDEPLDLVVAECLAHYKDAV